VDFEQFVEMIEDVADILFNVEAVLISGCERSKQLRFACRNLMLATGPSAGAERAIIIG
jgi:hypothetical protein